MEQQACSRWFPLFALRPFGESGQLALMDALAFFLVATTVSSVLLYYSSSMPIEAPPDHGHGMSDPLEVLETLLHSTLDIEILVDLDIPRYIQCGTEIDQCLLLEAEAILDGMAPEAFSQLNLAVSSLLEAISNPVYEPFLVILASSDAGAVTVLSIPGTPHESPQRYSASTDLVHDEEKDLVVQLSLCPAALSEFSDVLLSDLDLRARVLSPPPQLDP